MGYFNFNKLATTLAVVLWVTCTVSEKLAGDKSEVRNRREIDPEEGNRDGKKPSFLPVPDLNRKSVNIKKSHEILRKALQEYLDFTDSDLGSYLNHMIQRSEPYVDEYGQVIHVYKKVFTFIYEQYNETLVQNYAVKHFDKDKLDMCSVARYLSHQHSVSDRKTLMKRMGDALEYRCHPCTPYKRKQYGETKVPDTSNINPGGVSPEESFIMCKGGFQETTTALPVTTLAPTTTTVKDNSEEFVMFDNYAPCVYSYKEICWSRDSCEYFLKGDIICDSVPLNTVHEVFRRTKRTTFDQITLNMVSSDDLIPDDVLSNKRTENLFLVGKSDDELIQLKIKSNAFSATKNLTKTLFIHNFDGSQLDLDFLSGFDHLTNLTFDTVANIQDFFPKLPTLPSLKILILNYVSGWVDVQTLPSLVTGLKLIIMVPHQEEDEVWDDETVESALEWLLISSANSLEYLSLKENQLTKIPPQIPSFKALSHLQITSTKIYRIKTAELVFSVPVVFLRLYSNSIKIIQPGAFQGDFKDAEIDLGSNSITKIDKSVFIPLIQDMEPGTGSIELRNNEMDCSRKNICNLAWLIRDRRHLVGDKIYGTCSNETSFSELLPSGFSHCPTES